MEENNAGIDLYDYESDDDEQLFSLQSKQYSKFSNKPGLCTNDLMSNREFEYLEDNSNGSDHQEYNYENHNYQENNSQYSGDYINKDQDDYSSEKKDYKNYNKFQRNNLDDSQNLDLSQPKKSTEYYKEKNYDTKDTIDNQLENFKNCFRQEEESKLGYNFYNSKESRTHEDYLTFQNTLNNETFGKREQQSNIFENKYSELNQKKFMKTEGDVFDKQNKELENRLEIMKSAAARMISSNYEKSETSSLQAYSKIPENNYVKGIEGEFDSSTNNLINSSRARVQQLDQVIKLILIFI